MSQTRTTARRRVRVTVGRLLSRALRALGGVLLQGASRAEAWFAGDTRGDALPDSELPASATAPGDPPAHWLSLTDQSGPPDHWLAVVSRRAASPDAQPFDIDLGGVLPEFPADKPPNPLPDALPGKEGAPESAPMVARPAPTRRHEPPGAPPHRERRATRPGPRAESVTPGMNMSAPPPPAAPGPMPGERHDRVPARRATSSPSGVIRRLRARLAPGPSPAQDEGQRQQASSVVARARTAAPRIRVRHAEPRPAPASPREATTASAAPGDPVPPQHAQRQTRTGETVPMPRPAPARSPLPPDPFRSAPRRAIPPAAPPPQAATPWHPAAPAPAEGGRTVSAGAPGSSQSLTGESVPPPASASSQAWVAPVTTPPERPQMAATIAITSAAVSVDLPMAPPLDWPSLPDEPWEERDDLLRGERWRPSSWERPDVERLEREQRGEV
jgi:hypothetical protein